MLSRASQNALVRLVVRISDHDSSDVSEIRRRSFTPIAWMTTSSPPRTDWAEPTSSRDACDDWTSIWYVSHSVMPFITIACFSSRNA